MVDEHGIPTGQIIERTRAHELGTLHRTSHVWLVRIMGGRLQVLLQKRSSSKDSYPGCYDISSAGHIPAGAGFVDSALRELKEELGICAAPGQLLYCGQRRFCFKEVFYGKQFYDNQVSNIYALWMDCEPEAFILQKEEVSEVCWFDFDDCMEKVRLNMIPNCIFLDEFQMVKDKAESTMNSLK